MDQDMAAVALAQVSEAQVLIAALTEDFGELGYTEWWDRGDDLKIVLDGAYTNLREALGLERERLSS